MAYAPQIFLHAGLGESAGAYATIMIGVAKLCATLFAVAKIDTLGRRPIMLVGALGCAASCATISMTFLTGTSAFALVGCISYTLFWSPSFGAIIFLLPS